MSRRWLKIGIVAVVVAGVAGIVAYQFTGGDEFSEDMNALRAEFNRDKGKVRLLALLSPT